MSKDLILAIDNGSQSLKSILFNLQGDIEAIETVPIEPYASPKPGWAEQAPEVFWSTLCECCRRLLSRGDVDKNRIAGVSLTTQRCTVVCLDEHGRPLRPAMVWPDTRRSTGHKGAGPFYTALFKLLGVDGTARSLLENAEANWLETNEPEIWERTSKFLFLSGYLTYRLIGELKDSVGCQVGYVPFDYKRLKWAGSWDWRRKGLPISIEQLPTLVPQGGELGRITRTASKDTKIPEGLPLIASATDKACEVLGSGGLEPDVGCLSFGTAATINVPTAKYVEPMFLVPPYPSAVPRQHTMEIQIYRGFWMVSWFKEQFGHVETLSAGPRGVTPETLFDELIRDIKPGSMGLVLQPYWSPGIKFPGPEAKGAVIGFQDAHTRAHLYRAILEGLAYALRHGKETIERRTGVPITHLRVSGGGSQSENAMQITADVFGLKAMRPHVKETSGLGAAISAACGLGLHSDYPSAVKAMTRTRDVFEPDERNRRLYDRLYRDVFLKMYKKLRPLYESIMEITGSPDR